VINSNNVTVTVSFYAKANTDITVPVRLVQVFGSGGSTAVTVDSINNSVTSSWQRFTATFTCPSLSGKTIGTSSYLELTFDTPDTYSTLDITGVQLEVGTEATPFEHRPYDMELARCQRYYEVSGTGTNFGSNLCVAQNTTRANCACAFPVAKRATPTISVYSSSGANTVVAPGVSAVTVTTDSHSIYGIQFLGGTFVANRPYLFYYIADSEL